MDVFRARSQLAENSPGLALSLITAGEPTKVTGITA